MAQTAYSTMTISFRGKGVLALRERPKTYMDAVTEGLHGFSYGVHGKRMRKVCQYSSSRSKLANKNKCRRFPVVQRHGDHLDFGISSRGLRASNVPQPDIEPQ